MVTVKQANRILLILLKDFSRTHTITSIAEERGLSRVGIWKILKKLEADKYIILQSVGKGKTGVFIIKINWDNVLVEKAMNLYLAEEALAQRRWMVNFASLEKEVDFLILYGSILHSPAEADDIDIIGVAPEKNLSAIEDLVLKIQGTQAKKIHAINFTQNEFRQELKKQNKAFLDALKKGVVLFGQEKFVEFISGLQK